MPSRSSNPLSYATTRRPRYPLWKALLAATLLAGIVLAAHRFWPALREHYQYLAWQRRCMDYSRPASMVVYDDDPNARKTVATQPGFGPVYYGPVTMPMYNPPFGHTPPVWAENPEARISWAGWGPRARYCEPIESLAFLQGRRSAAGHERLVAVRFVADLRWQSGCDVYLLGVAYGPAGWRPGSKVQRLRVNEPEFWSKRAVLLIPSRTQGSSHSQVFAGQPDPADQSRFTIRYTIDGAPGTVEGRLNDDDSVSLKVLDGPATRNAVVGPAHQ